MGERDVRGECWGVCAWERRCGEGGGDRAGGGVGGGGVIRYIRIDPNDRTVVVRIDCVVKIRRRCPPCVCLNGMFACPPAFANCRKNFTWSY